MRRLFPTLRTRRFRDDDGGVNKKLARRREKEKMTPSPCHGRDSIENTIIVARGAAMARSPTTAEMTLQRPKRISPLGARFMRSVMFSELRIRGRAKEGPVSCTSSIAVAFSFLVDPSSPDNVNPLSNNGNPSCSIVNPSLVDYNL